MAAHSPVWLPRCVRWCVWVPQGILRVQAGLGSPTATQCDAAQWQPGGAGVPSPPNVMSHRGEPRVAPSLWRLRCGSFFVIVLCGACLFAPASLWCGSGTLRFVRGNLRPQIKGGEGRARAPSTINTQHDALHDHLARVARILLTNVTATTHTSAAVPHFTPTCRNVQHDWGRMGR